MAGEEVYSGDEDEIRSGDEMYGLPDSDSLEMIYAPDGSFIGYAGNSTGYLGHTGWPDEDQIAPHGYRTYTTTTYITPYTTRVVRPGQTTTTTYYRRY